MFEWKDSFSVQVHSIDTQHQRLFELGRELYNLSKLSNQGIDNYDRIMNILIEMKDYTIYHFKYEETLMERFNYEKKDEHKVEHDQFIEKINELLSADIDGAQKKTIMDALVFIADWIEKHILKKDMQYAPLMAEQRVS
jgi:hemerythrin